MVEEIARGVDTLNLQGNASNGLLQELAADTQNTNHGLSLAHAAMQDLRDVFDQANGDGRRAVIAAIDATENRLLENQRRLQEGMEVALVSKHRHRTCTSLLIHTDAKRFRYL